jgi:hypothetical protein
VNLSVERTYMKRPVMMMLGIALFGSPPVGMAASSFSGSWAQDNAKSDRVPEPVWLTRVPAGGRGGGGRGGGPGGRGNAEVVINVQQDANSVQVTGPQGTTRNYTLDGKPYTSATETGVEKAAVTANLQGDTLVIATSRPYGGMPGNVTLQVKEVWSLSPDGRTLTIATTHSSPAAEKNYKQVFNRR